jgi:hypothetical protein
MLTDMSTTISIAALLISVASFGLALRLAWATKLSPPRLVGVASCLLLFTFRSRSTTAPERFLVPVLWLTNTGARPMLVQAAKLTITLDSGQVRELLPAHSVPKEALDSPNTFDQYDAVQHGLAPFGGFAVLPGERWSNTFAFPLGSLGLEDLQGEATVAFHVKGISTTHFDKVIEQQFSLARHEFNWLSWAAIEGPDLEYFYAVGSPAR